jgi:citrate lyase beta subunit
VLDVVRGGRTDIIILPKVTSPDHVAWLDLLLGQVEREAGLPVGRTRIEAQIEDARGLAAVNAIAAASPRLEALVRARRLHGQCRDQVAGRRRPARRLRRRRRVSLRADADPDRGAFA